MNINSFINCFSICSLGESGASTEGEIEIKDMLSSIGSSTKLGSSDSSVLMGSSGSSRSQLNKTLAQPPRNRREPTRNRRAAMASPGVIRLELATEDHGNHQHHTLIDPTRKKAYENVIKADGEGCRCCARAIDVDEAAGLAEAKHGGVGGESSLVSPADLTSPAHWGIFSAAGMLATFGITAAYRNITGGFQNLKNIRLAIGNNKKSLDRLEGHDRATQRLKGIQRGLEYSKFDTQWNIAVPGAVNGATSVTLMTTSVLSHPFAMPLLALYSILQSARGLYDTVRFWNAKLEPIKEVKSEQDLLYNDGVRKMNRITFRKRLFYPSNAIAFATLAVGASMLFLSAPGIAVFGGAALPMILGVVLLCSGSLITAFTNNRWTNKFRPRNGDIGLDRSTTDAEDLVRAVGERREMKKLMLLRRSALFSKFQTKAALFNLKRNLWQLAAILPYMSDYAAKKNHELSKQEIDFLNSNHKDLNEQVLSLVEALKDKSSAERFRVQPFNLTTNSVFAKTCHGLEELGLLDDVLKNYHNEYHVPVAEHNHATESTCQSSCCKHGKLEKELQRLNGFTKRGNEWHFDPMMFEEYNNQEVIARFNKAVAFTLMCTEPEKMRYEQYGADAAYWNLKWANS